jgi:hypothetical protein
VRERTTRDLSDKHEAQAAEFFGGRVPRGSGNQWRDKLDGRQHRLKQAFAFAWDCKATEGKSIGVTRAMWDKTVEQAGGERPMLLLRWYGPGLSVDEDLAVISWQDLKELIDLANGDV